MNDPNFNPWIKGESITAVKLNQAGSALAAATARIITGQAGGTPNAVPFPVTVVTVYDDYLVCRPLNITGSGADIYVAKPWELRKTPFDGQTLPNKDGTLLSYAYDPADTQARTVTDTTDSSTEDQVIVPAYVPAQSATVDGVDTAFTGTEITVQRVAFGPTASFVGSGDFTVNLEFEDMNRAGRAWAEDNGS